MNFYLSYSTAFANSVNTFNWNKTKKNEVYDLTKLCLHYLTKNYKNVYLITDKKGEEFFGDLNWSNIYTDLEGVISPKYKEVWSLGKLYAINLIANKNEPFFHIDYDFFILDRLPKNILNAQIVVQSREFACDIQYEIKWYERGCKNKYLKKYKRNTITYNCGIIGGNDYKFFQKYSENAIKAVEDPKNKKFWNRKYLFPAFVKACVAEQYYLCCFLKDNNRKPTLLFDNKPVDKEVVGPNDNYCPLNKKYFRDKKIIHLFGDHKMFFYKIYKNSNKEYLSMNLSIIDKIIKMFQEKYKKEARRNFRNLTTKESKDFKRIIKEIKKYKNAATEISFADPIPQEYRDKLIKNLAEETGKQAINKNAQFNPHIISQDHIEKGILPNTNIVQEVKWQKIAAQPLNKKDAIKIIGGPRSQPNPNFPIKRINKKNIKKYLKKLKINLDKKDKI